MKISFLKRILKAKTHINIYTEMKDDAVHIKYIKYHSKSDEENSREENRF